MRFTHSLPVLVAGLIAGLPLLSSCMKYGPSEVEVFTPEGLSGGVFVVNEGNFMYGNASLSYYDSQQIGPEKNKVENDVFVRANGISLGDVAQSMTMHNGVGYVVVNNSGVIFAIDPGTFQVKGLITGLVSPRYIHFVSDTKAYVTDLYASQLTMVNPQTYTITGTIPTPGHRSTEKMVACGDTLFVSCWSYDRTVLVIDTKTNTLIDSISVGIQPSSMALDAYNRLWVLSDGGFEGSPYGYSLPVLQCLDPKTNRLVWEATFPEAGSPSELCVNGARDTLYYINKAIWRMNVSQRALPEQPFLPYQGTLYYGLAVDPVSSDVYVADAIDYVQSGIVFRYSAAGDLVAQFKTGIIPGAFCFTKEARQ